MLSQRGTHIVAGVLIAVLAVIIVFVWRYSPTDLIDNAALEQWAEGLGVSAIPLFVAAGALFTAVGLPRQLAAFSAGYIWGLWAGLAIGTLAAIAGCAITFYVSRLLLGRFVAAKFPRVVSVLNRVIEKDSFVKIVILRLQPFGTNLATNLSAGVTTIRPAIFLLSSLVGYVPQMFIFALTGAGVRVGSTAQLVLSGVLFVISLVLAWFLYRKGTLFNREIPDSSQGRTVD